MIKSSTSSRSDASTVTRQDRVYKLKNGNTMAINNIIAINQIGPPTRGFTILYTTNEEWAYQINQRHVIYTTIRFYH